MEELKVIELACNKHQMILDKDLIDAEATYSYKYYDLTYGVPAYYSEIIPDGSIDTIIELNATADSVYLLEVKKSKDQEDDVYYYSMMVVLCHLEACKNYILQQILCDSLDCKEQHDCDNCDKIRDEWNIRLSELHMMHYELKRYVDRYALIVEQLITEDPELILLRMKDIVNKINVMVAKCTATKITVRVGRCNNCN